MEIVEFSRIYWDRVVAAVLVVGGFVALILGWLGTSDTGLAAEQIPYLISGGIFGVALIGVGCTVWLSADLQDEWRRLDSLDERLARLVAKDDGTAHLDGEAVGGREAIRSTRVKAMTKL